MARKNARPAAKKRQAKLKARIAERSKTGRRRTRSNYDCDPRPNVESGLAIAMALSGISRFDSDRS